MYHPSYIIHNLQFTNTRQQKSWTRLKNKKRKWMFHNVRCWKNFPVCWKNTVTVNVHFPRLHLIAIVGKTLKALWMSTSISTYLPTPSPSISFHRLICWFFRERIKEWEPFSAYIPREHYKLQFIKVTSWFFLLFVFVVPTVSQCWHKMEENIHQQLFAREIIFSTKLK